MKFRLLGKTGLKCSIIGFGCWGLGGVAYGPINEKTSINAVEKAFDLGINFFDTSDLYGKDYDGKSEIILGKTLKNKRDKVLIATKFGLLPHKGWHMPENYSLNYLTSALNNSLKRLRTDYIDLIQLHSPSLDTLKNKTKMFNVCNFLIKKQKEGKIRSFGISVRSPNDGLYVVKNFKKFQTIQANFNIIDQRSLENGLLYYCKKNNVGFIARTPLVYGYLTGRLTDKTKLTKNDHRKKWSNKQLKIWSNAPSFYYQLKNKKQSMAQFCLNFCNSYTEVSTTIPGMLNAKQVIENCKSAEYNSLNKNIKNKIFEIYKSNEWINLVNKKNV